MSLIWKGKTERSSSKKKMKKPQDAKLAMEKARFEREVEKECLKQKRSESGARVSRLKKEREIEEKQLEREKEKKRLKREIEEKLFERELEAKWQSDKLAAPLELERLQLERTRLERENIEARTEVQSAASSQAGQESVVAVTKTRGLCA